MARLKRVSNSCSRSGVVSSLLIDSVKSLRPGRGCVSRETSKPRGNRFSFITRRRKTNAKRQKSRLLDGGGKVFATI